MRTMEWQPSEDLINWGNEHFASMAVDSIWSPDDSGVTFRKTDDKTYALVYRMNHPVSEEHYERLTILLRECGYTVEEPDDVQVVTPPLNPQAQAHMEFERRQEIARAWVCECSYPLANCDLDNTECEYVETVEAQTDTNETVPIDLWRYMLKCSNCDKVNSVDPDDFHLLAGDELFMKWNGYIALTRAQLKDFADAGMFDEGYDNGITVLGQERNGERVPPWLWGLSVIHSPIREEE